MLGSLKTPHIEDVLASASVSVSMKTLIRQSLDHEPAEAVKDAYWLFRFMQQRHEMESGHEWKPPVGKCA